MRGCVLVINCVLYNFFTTQFFTVKVYKVFSHFVVFGVRCQLMML